MSSEPTYKSCGISDEILDGIHPKETTPLEEMSPENGEKKKEKPCYISDDILDGIHPKNDIVAN